jgi:hypothetical protein
MGVVALVVVVAAIMLSMVHMVSVFFRVFAFFVVVHICFTLPVRCEKAESRRVRRLVDKKISYFVKRVNNEK